MLDLSSPNAPTRVSGFFRRNLEEYARRTGLRLPTLRGLRPYNGKAARRVTDGRVGGRPIMPLAVNYDAGQAPLVQGVPAGVAVRAEVIRRGLRRVRVSKASPRLILNPGFGGLDYAQGPRLKADTPSGVRGALRDRRHPHDTQYYDQEVAPIGTSRELINQRMLTTSADRASFTSEEPRDRIGLVDRTKAQAYALGTAQVPAVTAEPIGSPLTSLLPLAAVGFVFWLVFRGR